MKIKKYFREKVKFGKFSVESENFSETGGNLKQRGKCIIASGDGRPWFNILTYLFIIAALLSAGRFWSMILVMWQTIYLWTIGLSMKLCDQIANFVLFRKFSDFGAMCSL